MKNSNSNIRINHIFIKTGEEYIILRFTNINLIRPLFSDMILQLIYLNSVIHP